MTWAEKRVKELAQRLSRVDGIQYDRYLVPHMSDEVELFERVLREVGLVEVLEHAHAMSGWEINIDKALYNFEQALKEKRDA